MLILAIAMVVSFVGCAEETTEEAVEEEAVEEGVVEEEVVEEFPQEPIEMIVPYNPGGSTDTVARIVAQHVYKHLPNNQNIIVNNVAGASGTMGLTRLFESEGDGYTIAMTPSGALGVQPLYGDTVYNYDSF